MFSKSLLAATLALTLGATAFAAQEAGSVTFQPLCHTGSEREP